MCFSTELYLCLVQSLGKLQKDVCQEHGEGCVQVGPTVMRRISRSVWMHTSRHHSWHNAPNFRVSDMCFCFTLTSRAHVTSFLSLALTQHQFWEFRRQSHFTHRLLLILFKACHLPNIHVKNTLTFSCSHIQSASQISALHSHSIFSSHLSLFSNLYPPPLQAIEALIISCLAC